MSTIYPEQQVNTFTTGYQQEPAVTLLADGSYVVIWSSQYQDDGAGSYGIYGQRFSASGVPVGPEFQVNTYVAGSQVTPRVIGLSDSGFVVAWVDQNGQDGSSYGVYAQRFDANGSAQGGEFRINTTTSSTQSEPSIAAYTGGFVATWTSYNQDGSANGVYAQRYSNAGVPVGAEFKVNATTSNNQQESDVAANADGSFVVVWSSYQDSNTYGVYAQRYDATGTAAGTEFKVSSQVAGGQVDPKVAMLAGGGFVVVWTSDSGQDGSGNGVYAQRYDAAGAVVGSEFLINQTVSGGQYQADVEALANGGFVVTWYNDNYDATGTGSYQDIYVREYAADGSAATGQVKVNTPMASQSGQYQPAIAHLGSDNYVVVWRSDSQDGSASGVYQQLFGTASELPRQSNPTLGDFTGTVTFGENAVNAAGQIIDAAVSLSDPDSANFAGGQLDLFYVQYGEASDQLSVRNQGTGAGQIGLTGNTVSYSGTAIGTLTGGANGANLVISLNASATVDAVEALVQNLTYGSTSQSPAATRTVGLRISDGGGGSSAASTVTINVTPELDGKPVAYGEERVNTYTASTQEEPEVAVLNDGSYVVVWQSYGQDAVNTNGIYFQHFAANGTAIGGETRVNTALTGGQDYPHIAALSDGGFVITWQDNNGFDTSGWGIVAQRYNGSGVAQGANFVVNTTTNSSQYHDAVAGYTGGFAAVWTSTGNSGGNGYDIYLKRFDNAGNQVLGETRISTVPGAPATAQTGTQEVPDIAARADGSLVIVWQDTNGNDGSSYGVYARTVSSTGVLSDTFLVNTTTTSTQYEPSVATLSDGGFVVVWRSDNQDGSSAGVYGQRFNAAGAKVGGEFLVNETTAGGQYQPTVTGLSTGGFVVSFYNDNYDLTGTGTYGDVYIREYDASGNAIDGQRKLASSGNYYDQENLPAIADLGNGNFVVVYSDYVPTANGGNNTTEITQQIFGTGASLARGSNPEIGDLTSLRTLSGTVASPLYAGNPQLIDSDVAVSDADSTNFDGGQLTITLANGATATETLAVRNQGIDVGQISISGADVSYGNTVIGTVSGGGAGISTMVITLNASADAVVVRALIENITYQNSVPPAGTTDRYVSFRLTDGDGGVSEPKVVQLRIQATVTPAAVAVDDVVSTLNISESQANAGVLVDDAVQVIYSGTNSFNNGKLTVSYVSSTSRVEDQLSIRNEGNGANQVGVSGSDVSYGGTVIGSISAADNGVNGDQLIVTFNASATDQAVERVIECLRFSSTSEDPNASRTIRIVVTDSASATSTARDVVINISPETDPSAAAALTGEMQANSYENGNQQDSAVARLYGANDGGYVVTWVSYDAAQDGDGYSVHAQRFDANGAAQGAEIAVNTYTLGNQYQPAVGGLADGGFVIAWRSYGQTGDSDWGIYAQRYDVSGQAVGSEFRVNSTTTSTQDEPTVLGLSDGTFVVAYSSDYSNAAGSYTYDVLAQRYAANGTPLGSEFTINTNLNSTQYQAQLSVLSGGGFVAIWTDTSGADGNGYGIIVQRFANDGSKVGSEIVVNTTFSGTQEGADVVGLNGGGFVAVWHYNSSTYAQRFDASGVKVGAEILVSDVDAPANYNAYARVAALGNGGFTVSWDSVNALGGSGYDILAQQFDSAGNRIDGVFIANSVTTNTQIQPDLVGLTGNNFVISWSGYDQERNTDNTYGVFHRVFGTAGSISSSAAPVLVDVSSGVTFVESLVNAAPQLIDASVGLSDADSTNFDGGRLWVSVISSYPDNSDQQLADDLRSQDQLGIRNQGTGAGQVGVSGGNVTYGGVNIGTIELGGANGSDLVVRFNTSATTNAVEAVIENLTYANNSSAPGATRTVSISVSDGDGATSAPKLVTINVTPEADGYQALFGNEVVNTYRTNSQDEAAGAALSDGGYVIVWASEGQDGSNAGIHGQRYTAAGERVGAEFEINTHTLNTQQSPAVTGLASGGFVVTWQSSAQDGSGYGIYAQRYTADGSAMGGEFRVNTMTSSSQQSPAIVATADGGFVVAWHHDYYNADNSEYNDIYFQRYNASGVAQGPETKANPSLGSTFLYQSEPSIAALSGGGFIVLWTDTSNGDGNSYGVFGQRFAADGAAAGASFQVNTYTVGAQYESDVVGLSSGGFVAVWRSDGQDGSSAGVFAQRFNASGNKVGGEFRVNTEISGNEYEPSVTALANGGFAVAWNDDSRTYVQQFAADGSRVDGDIRVDTIDNNSNANQPDVIGLNGGGFVVTWRDYNYSNSTYEVYQQVFGNPVTMTRQAAPVITDMIDAVTFGENLVNASPQLIDASIDLSDADSANFAGGQLWVSVISGYGDISYAQLPEAIRAQDQLGIRNEGTAAGQVSISGNTVSVGGVAIGTIASNGSNGTDLVVTFNGSATESAVEAVIENLTYGNSSSAPVGSRAISISVSDGDGGTSEPRVVTVNVTPEADGAQALFGNEVVNTYHPGTQSNAAIGQLNDGGYVVAWSSDGQDGWGYGVHAQRYDANGVAVGSEFQINTYTPNNQQEPTVVGLSNGGFVIAWESQSQDGSGYGIFAQRFDSNGVPVGNEFLVNTSSDNDQTTVDIAALPNGGFIATWYSYYQDGNYYNIYAQRFDGAGSKVGAEFRVNTSAGFANNGQYDPAVSSFADGSFVIVWRSDNQDGSGAGVFGQRYDAAGAAVGAEFQVNTFTADYQYEPDVTALTGGGFVVVWHSNSQDGSSGGIFGQRYDSNGATLGNEFRINTETSGNEAQPAVTALSNGGFAVSYYDDGRIAVQQFNAAGIRVDNEARVDTHDTNASGSLPAIQGLANGAFVVAWQDYDYTNGNTYEIYQQFYGNPTLVTRQANPELVDMASSVTFAENTINAVPQLIDAGVGLFDADSANFDGGLLEVNYITDYGAQDQLGLQSLDNQDQLGIRSVGTGAGQVSVAGASVSYGGVVIGTIISNGANGEKLAVQFNANATVDAVEHVIESLTYANTVSNPIASRTVSIRVTDGDGGSSEARSVTINVTPETDGAVRFGLERTVNTTLSGYQYQPDIARLADGGYVVVWEDSSGADGSGSGVYGQRYDANDNAVGGEFKVNTYVNSTQNEPQVMGLSGGGFVVVWSSQGEDGSGWGVYGQRYNADGTTAGSEFRVNTTTNQSQYQPTLEATSDGGFVVAWYHDYYNVAFTEYADVFFQRFNASGVAIGAETRANPAGVGMTAQSQPSLATLNDGSFVVLWTDSSGDGSGSGVFGQRFNASGVAQGISFQVNAYTNSTQEQAAVTALKDGGFLVTWQSSGQDLSGWGVYAQRYDAAGAQVGTEFRVNTTISGGQYDVDVTALENGGWVVAWYSDHTGDVYMQQYNAAGSAVDGEIRVNSYDYSSQSQPAIASMADGGFVVTWAGYVASHDSNGDGTPDGGNDTYEIKVQRYSNTAPAVSDVSVNGQEEAVIVLSNTLFEAGFNDPDGQTLQAIKVITLPGEGILRLDGVAVLPDQEISLADLQAGKLTYQGNADFFGQDQFRWTGSDGIAFASTPVFTLVNLSNVNDSPRLEAGADATANEGNGFSHNIELGDPDPEGHQITVDWGDGSAAQVYNVANTPNHSISHYYVDNGTYAVMVTADDQRGQANSVQADSFQVVVANVAPTISLFGNVNVVQNDVYTLDLGGVSDPGADTVTEYQINWGDGSPVQVILAANLPSNREVTHTFATVGAPTISVAIKDEDGTFTNAGTKSITVAPPAEVITVEAGVDMTVNEGTNFNKTISFSDPNDQAPAGRTYTVTWGDGTTSTGSLSSGALSFNISHQYADDGTTYDVTVTVDDSGAQQGSDSFQVAVQNVAPTLNLSASSNVAEGSPYVVTLNNTDPGADTITEYAINWGDGSAVEVIAAANLPANRQVSHVYSDGDTPFNISVSVTDEDGVWANAGTRSVFVNNVAPTAAVTGADTVAEGSVYTLTVGAVTEPGADTRNQYSITWGDGTTETYTAAQWAAAAGNFTHTYADGGNGGTARTISVSATDEDGSFVLGSKAITVGNAAPNLNLSGNASTNEGAAYVLAIAASDAAGTADPLSYSINWGDGSAVQTLTAAELLALSGNVSHTFADDEDGPINATARTISVTANDGDGGSTTQTKEVMVNNVAPTVALSGAATVDAASVYTLNLGALIDPGQDSASAYILDWGDGTVQSFTPAGFSALAGVATHTYASGSANRTIQLTVTDDDGSFIAGATSVTVNDTQPPVVLNLGDAPARLTASDPNAWINAWSEQGVGISHKANVGNSAEAWSAVTLNGLNGTVLAGGDLFSGDLGVSAQTLLTSTIRQEIDGTEALRFDLNQSATKVTVDLARFYVDDDANTFNFNEAGRLQGLDAQGNVVKEISFVADAASGIKEISMDYAGGFSAVVLTAGAYHDGTFVFGAYANDAGQYASDPYLGGGKLHGSDFLVHAIEFQLAPVVNADHGQP